MNEEATSTPNEADEQAQGTTPETVDTPDEQPKPVMIPKERFDQVNQRLKDAEKAAAELEALKQAQADEAAKKAGDLEKFQKERDEYKAQAEAWTKYAGAKLEELTAGLDDTGRDALEIIADAPLDKRLALAEKLAAAKKPDAGMGTTGGRGKSGGGGPIPADVQTVRDFHDWLTGLQSTAEGRAKLADPEFNRAVTAERLQRFGAR